MATCLRQERAVRHQDMIIGLLSAREMLQVMVANVCASETETTHCYVCDKDSTNPCAD